MCSFPNLGDEVLGPVGGKGVPSSHGLGQDTLCRGIDERNVLKEGLEVKKDKSYLLNLSHELVSAVWDGVLAGVEGIGIVGRLLLGVLGKGAEGLGDPDGVEL